MDDGCWCEAEAAMVPPPALYRLFQCFVCNQHVCHLGGGRGSLNHRLLNNCGGGKFRGHQFATERISAVARRARKLPADQIATATSRGVPWLAGPRPTPASAASPGLRWSATGPVLRGCWLEVGRRVPARPDVPGEYDPPAAARRDGR